MIGVSVPFRSVANCDVIKTRACTAIVNTILVRLAVDVSNHALFGFTKGSFRRNPRHRVVGVSYLPISRLVTLGLDGVVNDVCEFTVNEHAVICAGLTVTGKAVRVSVKSVSCFAECDCHGGRFLRAGHLFSRYVVNYTP